MEGGEEIEKKTVTATQLADGKSSEASIKRVVASRREEQEIARGNSRDVAS